MSKFQTLFTLAVLAAPIRPVAAEPTRELRYGGPKEMFEGDPESAALTVRGTVVAASVIERQVEGSSPVTALARGGDGRLYVGTVGGLFEARDGKLRPIDAEVEGSVTSLIRTASGIWAGFSPSGRVVAVAEAKAVESFAVEAEYVWDLAVQGQDLWIATGLPGRLLVRKGDQVETVWKSSEAHLRRVIVGKEAQWFCTGEKGVIMERRSGAVRALFDSGLEECTGLALGPAGEVFASLVSTQRKPGTAPYVYIPAVGDDEEKVESPFKGSELVRIDRDGGVRLLWRSQREGAMDLAVFGEELVMATATGPGAKGRVYAFAFGDEGVRLDGRVEAAAVSALLPRDDGAFLLGTAPGGAVLRRAPELRPRSLYRSTEQDFQRVGRVGRLWFDAALPSGTKVQVRIRTGNTSEADETWSKWSKPCDRPQGCEVDVPEGRYAQFEATLRPKGSLSPELRSMHASVVRLNEAPRIFEVFALQPGVVVEALPPNGERDKTITVSGSSLEKLRQGDDEDEPVRARQSRVEGRRTLAWKAGDTNGDDLLYTVEIRRAGQDGAWVELAEELPHPFFSFDTRAFADGSYEARVHANDRPSNPPSETRSTVHVSSPFLIDNGAPQISKLRARSKQGDLQVEARLRDAESVLAKAEVSIDGGPWLLMSAEDGMIDGNEEQIRVRLPGRGSSSVVALRVEDEAGNQSSASVVVD
ncbi:MAG: hypothetical protein AAGD10_16000 [Myxococcota bacterium]